MLLGNEEMIEKRAARLGLDLTGVEIVNLRHDREADRRQRYAELFCNASASAKASPKPKPSKRCMTATISA